MRFGFASVHARVGRCEHTLAWLSASICQFVFMFEGFSEAPLSTATTTTCNSWSFFFTVKVDVIVALVGATRLSADVERYQMKCDSHSHR